MSWFVIKSIPEIVFARPFSATRHKFINRKYFLTEIIYVTEGCLELAFGEKEFRVNVGDCLIIPYGSLVSCRIPEDFTCNSHLGLAFICEIAVTDEAPQAVHGQSHCPCFQAELCSAIENCGAFEQLFTQLITAYSHNNVMESISLLFRLLGIISAQPLRLAQSTPNNEVYTRKMIGYIEANFDKKITISEIAKTVLITPEYASNIFKSTQGESILSYVNKVKIRHAKLLLKNTDMSLCEIASSIGIHENTAYFSRFFKKNVGMTPSEYKRIIQRQDLNVKLPGYIR